MENAQDITDTQLAATAQQQVPDAHMQELNAYQLTVENLRARVDALTKAAELDATRLLWAMNHMHHLQQATAYASHVLQRGGNGDLGDACSYIDTQLAT